MADEASATVKVDQNGRVYLPAQTRRALDIHGEEARLDLDVAVIERLSDKDESHGESEE